MATMMSWMKRAAAVAVAVAGLALSAAPASAQSFSSEEQLRTGLNSRGYRVFRIEEFSRSQATVVVCSAGRRERLRVAPNFTTRFLANLGSCPDLPAPSTSGSSSSGGSVSRPSEPDLPEIPELGGTPGEGRGRIIEGIYERLGADGYVVRDVLRREGGVLLAKACKDEVLYDITFTIAGRLGEIEEVGECLSVIVRPGRRPVAERSVPSELAKLGYYRVRVTGRLEEGYAASACHGARRFLLELDETAQILSQRLDRNDFCTGDGFDRLAVPQRPGGGIVGGSQLLTPGECQAGLSWLMHDYGIDFAAGSTRLARREADLLREIAAQASRCPDIERIYIDGHTDSAGSEDANLRLSELRAAAVREILVDAGLNPSRVIARGFGEDFPIVPNDTAANRATNRRIEMNLEWGLR